MIAMPWSALIKIRLVINPFQVSLRDPEGVGAISYFDTNARLLRRAVGAPRNDIKYRGRRNENAFGHVICWSQSQTVISCSTAYFYEVILQDIHFLHLMFVISGICLPVRKSRSQISGKLSSFIKVMYLPLGDHITSLSIVPFKIKGVFSMIEHEKGFSLN